MRSLNYRSTRTRPLIRSRRVGYGALIGGVIIVLILIAAVWFTAYKNSERTVETVVTGKERVCETTSDGQDCKYLVFTDAGTFKVTDGYTGSGGVRFSSSDVYGRIVNGPATIDVIGWRVPIFSSYPNIVRIEQ